MKTFRYILFFVCTFTFAFGEPSQNTDIAFLKNLFVSGEFKKIPDHNSVGSLQSFKVIDGNLGFAVTFHSGKDLSIWRFNPERKDFLYDLDIADQGADGIVNSVRFWHGADLPHWFFASGKYDPEVRALWQKTYEIIASEATAAFGKQMELLARK